MFRYHIRYDVTYTVALEAETPEEALALWAATPSPELAEAAHSTEFGDTDIVFSDDPDWTPEDPYA